MYIDISKCNDYDGTRASPSHKRTTNPKACISMPLEKLGRSDLSLVDRYLYLQHFFLNSAVAVMGERRDKLCSHLRIARSYHWLIVLISVLIQRVHKLYSPGSCSNNFLVKLYGRLAQISYFLCTTSSKRIHITTIGVILNTCLDGVP